MRQTLKITIVLFVALLARTGQTHAGLVVGYYGSNSDFFIKMLLESHGHQLIDLNFNLTPTTLSTVDTVLLLRTDANDVLKDYVLSGGRLVTEWTGSAWALNTAGLLDATDTGGGPVGTSTPVHFTAAGISSGLADNVANPYSDAGRTEYFRNLEAIGPEVHILATYGAGNPAIIGGASGLGTTLVIGYDWSDQFGHANPDHQQLFLNAVMWNAPPAAATPVIPEPTSLILLGMGQSDWPRGRSGGGRILQPADTPHRGPPDGSRPARGRTPVSGSLRRSVTAWPHCAAETPPRIPWCVPTSPAGTANRGRPALKTRTAGCGLPSRT